MDTPPTSPTHETDSDFTEFDLDDFIDQVTRTLDSIIQRLNYLETAKEINNKVYEKK